MELLPNCLTRKQQIQGPVSPHWGSESGNPETEGVRFKGGCPYVSSLHVRAIGAISAYPAAVSGQQTHASGNSAERSMVHKERHSLLPVDKVDAVFPEYNTTTFCSTKDKNKNGFKEIQLETYA